MIATMLLAAASVEARLATIERLVPPPPPVAYYAPREPYKEPWYLRLPFVGGTSSSCYNLSSSVTCSVNIRTPNGTISGQARIRKP
jgi:hypothetical protein